ncbi:MAG: SDR family oxidoreductase, partial [bacterium]|nr:SDR family oxidoreductase [bacterium]
GIKGTDDIGVYGISKAADSALVRNLAVRWGEHNIRCNAIAPGLIKTDFARAFWENPERLAQVEASYPLRRIGEPDEIAGAAVMLPSQAGRYITGQPPVVDGGSTIVAGV